MDTYKRLIKFTFDRNAEKEWSDKINFFSGRICFTLIAAGLLVTKWSRVVGKFYRNEMNTFFLVTHLLHQLRCLFIQKFHNFAFICCFVILSWFSWTRFLKISSARIGLLLPYKKYLPRNIVPWIMFNLSSIDLDTLFYILLVMLKSTIFSKTKLYKQQRIRAERFCALLI